MAPNPASPRSLTVDNIENGEELYQRCVLIRGQCNGLEFVTVTTRSDAGEELFPIQSWPIADGHFRGLAFLAPGTNNLFLGCKNPAADVQFLNLKVKYTPLLQNPPLHLAILVAKDSPLLIDCPPGKYSSVSSAHSGLEAAISKLRMTAYMWQAFTAEEMHAKKLGRRSFRLEEEWTTDTISKEFHHAATEQMHWNGAMCSTAKVHVVSCDKTVAELCDAQIAQQNPSARRKDDLHKYFTAALKAYGGPFMSSARPVVAGLILDSHYSVQQNLLLGHAALGASDPSGLSLGIFGSHLTYSWPRFIEEVTSTLTDECCPGDTVCNDNKECASFWEACSVGQGAFLHEVGHAFGATHTSGIMARGYAQHWPRAFLSHTAFCMATKEEPILTSGAPNNSTWDTQDALSFKILPHFKLPTDRMLSKDEVSALPEIQVQDDDEDFPRFVIKGSMGGIARIRLNDVDKTDISHLSPPTDICYTVAELEDLTNPPRQPLKIEILGMNGKVKIFPNIWRLLGNRSYVKILGTDLRLQKRAISTGSSNHSRDNNWEWAVMLKKRGAENKLIRATAIDLRVGCIFDGAVMYYADGSHVNLGPVWRQDGSDHHFGGHASKKLKLPEGKRIVKVEVNDTSGGWGPLGGIRMHLSFNGTAVGELNAHSTRDYVNILEPTSTEVIVGFYGKSQVGSGYCCEFGIITAPADAKLPDSMYDLYELQNTDGGLGQPRPGAEKRDEVDNEDESEDYDVGDEDEDESY